MSDGLTDLYAPEAPRPAAKAPSPAPTVARPLFGDDEALLRAVIAVGVVLALWKLFIALTGNVIWEEGHFAVLGQRPDLAYPDIPAGWPLFARLCTTLFGWSPAAIRLPGLIVAETIPLAVYWLARGLVSRREALWAAMIAILAPALGMSGTIFYPEEALQIALAVMLGAIVRALRAERPGQALRLWALAGAAGALGLFVHFRFVLVGAGVVLFLVASPVGRRQWGKPGLWLAAALAALGLIPGLIYNIREQWPALAYQVANRPSYRFMPGWLLTFFENQLGLATPAFFVAFAIAAKRAFAWARRGDGPAALLLSVAGVIFVLYGLLSLVDSQVMPHWPFLAYVALVPLAPGVLIDLVDAARSFNARRLRMVLIGAFGPLVTLLGGIAGTAFEEGWAHADQLPAAAKPLLFTRLEDWKRLEPALARAAADAEARFPGAPPAIATAGHISALRLEFPGVKGRQVYALDEPYDEFTRFSVIRRAWGLDEAGLKRAHAGQGVVIALPEPSYLYNTAPEMAFRERLCGEFDGARPVETAELPPGRVAVTLFSARVGAPALRTSCAFLPRLYIGQPTRAARLRHGKDATGLFGLASDPAGVAKVEALLDGMSVTEAQYGLQPPGAALPKAFADDPHYPKLWFSYALPGGALTPGEHRLSVRATLTDGRTLDSEARTIFVR